MAILLCFFCAAQFLFIGYLLGKGKKPQSAPSAFKAGAEDGEKEAFALLMGYNADVAYGVKQMTEE